MTDATLLSAFETHGKGYTGDISSAEAIVKVGASFVHVTLRGRYDGSVAFRTVAKRIKSCRPRYAEALLSGSTDLLPTHHIQQQDGAAMTHLSDVLSLRGNAKSAILAAAGRLAEMAQLSAHQRLEIAGILSDEVET